MKFKMILILSFFQVLVFLSQGQTPFFSEIQHFKEIDSLNPPKKSAILFVGSSSFTKWTDVQSYFPDFSIINRGFGGSSLPDVIRFADDIIFPYQPKQIVIYCGENDLATADTSISGTMVFERFKKLYSLIRANMPTVPIAYVSMKPSPSRKKLFIKMIEGNMLIKKFLNQEKNTSFINVFDAMFTPDGSVMRDIFIADDLHMNAKGYSIWQKIIEPYLLK